VCARVCLVACECTCPRVRVTFVSAVLTSTARNHWIHPHHRIRLLSVHVSCSLGTLPPCVRACVCVCVEWDNISLMNTRVLLEPMSQELVEMPATSALARLKVQMASVSENLNPRLPTNSHVVSSGSPNAQFNLIYIHACRFVGFGPKNRQRKSGEPSIRIDNSRVTLCRCIRTPNAKREDAREVSTNAAGSRGCQVRPVMRVSARSDAASSKRASPIRVSVLINSSNSN